MPSPTTLVDWSSYGKAVWTAEAIQRRTSWENQPMPPRRLRTPSRPVLAGLIAAMIVLLAVLVWVVPPRAVVLHNILHHLNILPFLLAGLIFGWRGALRALLFATLLLTPSIVRHWGPDRLDAQDQIVELSTFGIAGIVAGLLADRERMQRRHVESTRNELQRVYNELAQNIEHLRKNERLSAAGQLSASLAHEIRNPLASISGAAGILARGHATPASQLECTDILTRESQRLNKLLTNFLDFARPRLPRFQLAEPFAVVESTVLLAQHTAATLNVALHLQPAPSLPELSCDPEQIKQVLLNLILNALQASQPAPTVPAPQVLVRLRQLPDYLAIEVIDTGKGVPPHELESIFDPFFTTRENGSGLGLAIAANIVAQHSGTLTGIPNAGPGMTFQILLPWHHATTRHAPRQPIAVAS